MSNHPFNGLMHKKKYGNFLFFTLDINCLMTDEINLKGNLKKALITNC